MNNEQRIVLIRTRIEEHLQPEHVEVIDESKYHAGHPGAASGAGHFAVNIVANAFDGKNLVERHRLVYHAIGDAMGGEIHALRIQAKTPGEV